MTLPRDEKKKREGIRGIMRDIAREIWKLPAARREEIEARLLSILRNFETENNGPRFPRRL